jgi:hypothetical protein
MREYSSKRLKLGQLLGQLGVFLTRCPSRCRPRGQLDPAGHRRRRRPGRRCRRPGPSHRACRRRPCPVPAAAARGGGTAGARTRVWTRQGTRHQRVPEAWLCCRFSIGSHPHNERSTVHLHEARNHQPQATRHTRVCEGCAGGVKQSTFCMARRKTMINMGSPYFVWINANGIISSWYLLGAVCVAPPGCAPG